MSNPGSISPVLNPPSTSYSGGWLVVSGVLENMFEDGKSKYTGFAKVIAVVLLVVVVVNAVI